MRVFYFRSGTTLFLTTSYNSHRTVLVNSFHTTNKACRTSANLKFSSKRTLVTNYLSSPKSFSTTTANQTKYNKKMKLSVTTWNIAAINNNPFEYWLTISNNPEYELLMKNIEEFIENPTDDTDILVKDRFTNEMFARLDKRLTNDAGWESVESYWIEDFQNRKIISQFMKDKALGSKRLASMPDRITNTINLAGGTNGKSIACRPTVINMYDGDLSTMDVWYNAWESFMFDHKLSINVKGTVKELVPYEMLQPIKKSKYPDITEEEEKVSLPLQTLCGAIFDGILVHMMNTVSKPDVWQPLKKTIVDSLTTKKVPKTLEILEERYMPISDIITLQEVSSAFIEKAKTSKLGAKYHVIAPNDIDSTRDQNSVIMLCKTLFPTGKIDEITSSVSSNFPKGKKVPVANGDILVITTKDKDDAPYIIASFHGDTNGLATIPVLDAIMTTKASSYKDHKLLFGLDANTYEKAKPGKMQDVLEFGKSYTSHNLTSCFGNVPNPSNYTTYNARTYLQPQLNKACKSSDKRKLGDVNPKDFILFDEDCFSVIKTWKDNTGNVDMEYIEDMAFPTLDFPSDHGILSTTIESK